MILIDPRLTTDTEDEYFPEKDTSIYEDASYYQPTEYEHIRMVVNYLHMGKDDVFVDLGCGKGRVLEYVGTQDIRKMVGVELHRELAEVAEMNLKARGVTVPFEIYTADAATFFSPDGTVFYLFNPFGNDTVREVVANIRKSLIENPRRIRIVYNNSVHSYHLSRCGWLEEEGQLDGSRIRIWKNRTPLQNI